MWTKEERDEHYQQLLKALKPEPPPPKPTSERWTQKDDVTVQQLVVSTEAGRDMAQRWRDRRQELEAKEYTEWNDPRARYQRELDRWWQAKLDMEAALDDGFDYSTGYKERRYKTTCHRGKGDPDYGL
jgi:hypothetical protein